MERPSNLVVSLLATLVLASQSQPVLAASAFGDRTSRPAAPSGNQSQSRPSPSPSPAPSRPAPSASSPSSGGSRPFGGSSSSGSSFGGSRGSTSSPYAAGSGSSSSGRGSYAPTAPTAPRPAPVSPSTYNGGYDRSGGDGSSASRGGSRAPARESAPLDAGGAVRWRTGDPAPTRDSGSASGSDTRRGGDASRGGSSSGSFENPARTDSTGWGSGTSRDARGVSSAPSEATPRYLPRVWESDQGVWRTKAQPAPVPRISSAARADGDASLSRARLERANGAPLVGGVGARAGAAPAAARTGLQPASLDRQGLLERYARTATKDAAVKETGQRGAAEPGRSGADRANRPAGSAAESGLSTRRGARARTEAATERARADAAEKQAADGTGLKRVQPAPARTSRRGEAQDEPRRKQRDAVQRAAVERMDDMRRTDPEGARRLERTSAELAVAAHSASRVSIGVAVGAWTGCNTGWWWPAYDSSCSWSQPWWWWNTHCGSWNWGFGWNSCHGWYGGFGWSSGWYGSSCYRYDPWCTPAWYWYPSVVWCHDPVVVERIVEREVVVEREVPVAAGEAVVAAGAEPSPAQEIVDALAVAARKHLDEGDAAFREGRYADAVHHYARALECSPQDAGLHLVLADALFATGDYHYCAWSLRRAVELDPTVLDADVDKHAFYADPAEFDRQIALAESFLEDHFLDDDARLVLAFNYHCAKRHADAAQLLENAFSAAVLDSAAGAKVHERAAAALDQR